MSLLCIEDIAKSPLIRISICGWQSIFQTADKKDGTIDQIDACCGQHGKHCQIFQFIIFFHR